MRLLTEMDKGHFEIEVERFGPVWQLASGERWPYVGVEISEASRWDERHELRLSSWESRELAAVLTRAADDLDRTWSVAPPSEDGDGHAEGM